MAEAPATEDDRRKREKTDEASRSAQSRRGTLPTIVIAGNDSLVIPEKGMVVPPPSLENMSSDTTLADANTYQLLKETEYSVEKILSETRGNLWSLSSPTDTSNDQEEDPESSLEGESGFSRAHVMTCRICQLFVRTVDRLLDKSEQLMDQYLPLTEEEIGNLQQAIQELDTPNADHQMQTCLARINDLSSQLRQRAYMLALSKLRLARQSTQESFCQLHQTITLIEQVQTGGESERRASHVKLDEMCKSWAQKQGQQSTTEDTDGQKEEDQEEEVLVASTVIEEPKTFPSGNSHEEEPETHPTEESHEEEPETHPTEESYEEEPETRPTEDIHKEEPKTRPTEDIQKEEPRTHPTEDIHKEEPRTRPTEDIHKEEPRILCTVDTCKKEVEIISERSHREKSRSPCTEGLSIDEAEITMTVPGCEHVDGLPVPPPHRSRRASYAEASSSQVTESNALEMSKTLISHLQTMYEGLLVNLQDVPASLKNRLHNTCQHMAELQASFASANNFGDLASSVLNNSMNIMAEAEDNMDDLMDFAFQNPISISGQGTEAGQPEETGRPSSQEKDEKERQDILKIQKAYDPKGCEDD